MKRRMWWAVAGLSAGVIMTALAGLALWPIETWWWSTPAVGVIGVLLIVSAVKAQDA